MLTKFISRFAIVALALGITATLAARSPPEVIYSPSLVNGEGNQPLFYTYVQTIISPDNVVSGQSTAITPVLTVTGAPAGVSNTIALSFVTMSPSTLVFTGPNQALTTTVTCDFPAGTSAGEYTYAISTPGWPTGTVDNYGFINAKVFVPPTAQPPLVSLLSPADRTLYTYAAGGPPAAVNVSFTASASAASPIISIDADISGVAVPLTVTGVGTAAATGQGTLLISQPGIYSVQARAVNNVGTSTAAAEITVNVVAGPPTVAIAAPLQGGSHTLFPGTPLLVPFSFSAASAYGGITSLTATLNGVPVALSPVGLDTLNASATGNLSIQTSGSALLTVTATDRNGTATASRTFTVTSAVPAPTVTIAQPLNGAIITRVAGSPATSIPFAFTSTVGTGFVINSISATLNNGPVAVTSTGIGTRTAGGTGTLSVSAPGAYTLVATGTSGTATASGAVAFTVTETQPPTASCGIFWLPPISLGKVEKGGSVVPIKFHLVCCDSSNEQGDHKDKKKEEKEKGKNQGNKDGCPKLRDTSVVIAIHEIFPDGSTSQPVLYPYGTNSPNPPNYTINGNDMYHLNFTTARGDRRYHIDVYRFPAGSATPQLVGTRQFTTR